MFLFVFILWEQQTFKTEVLKTKKMCLQHYLWLSSIMAHFCDEHISTIAGRWLNTEKREGSDEFHVLGNRVPNSSKLGVHASASPINFCHRGLASVNADVDADIYNPSSSPSPPDFWVGSPSNKHIKSYQLKTHKTKGCKSHKSCFSNRASDSAQFYSHPRWPLKNRVFLARKRLIENLLILFHFPISRKSSKFKGPYHCYWRIISSQFFCLSM